MVTFNLKVKCIISASLNGIAKLLVGENGILKHYTHQPNGQKNRPHTSDALGYLNRTKQQRFSGNLHTMDSICGMLLITTDNIPQTCPSEKNKNKHKIHL